MWKKISFVAVLGLGLGPSAAMAVFNPFDGIVDGIAQGLASGDDITMTSTKDQGIQGGNVIIGHGNQEKKQVLEVARGLTLTMVDGNNTTQAANVVVNDPSVAVLTMQEAFVEGATNLDSSNSSTKTVQAINLVTTCSDCTN